MSEKVIIPCPSCQRSLRMPADRNLRADCPHCGRQFYVAYGKLHTERNRTVEIKNEGAGYATKFSRWRMRKGNPWYTAPALLTGLLLAMVFGGMVFKVAYLNEWNAFDRYQEEHTLESANQYLKSFGSRANAPFVRNGRDSLMVDEARIAMETSCERGSCDCVPFRRLQRSGLLPDWADRAQFAYEECQFRTLATEPDIERINVFIDEYPASVFIDSVATIRANLLKTAIADYKRNPGKASASRVFFQNTLEYLAANKDNTIQIVFRQTKALKDWNEYTTEERDLVDNLTDMGNAMEQTDFPRPSQRPPASIKSFFNASTSQLESRLTQTVQTRLDSLLGRGMIRVKKHQGESKPGGLVMEIDYHVSTLEDDAGPQGKFPSLYVWSSTPTNQFGLPNKLDPEQRRILREALASAEPDVQRQILAQYPDLLKDDPEPDVNRNGNSREFKGYLLATNIDWELTMSYPGNVKPYYYEESSRPMANINNVQSQTDAYRKMMSTAFDNFSLEFLLRFGAE